jgi:hypothetical protein
VTELISSSHAQGLHSAWTVIEPDGTQTYIMPLVPMIRTLGHWDITTSKMMLLVSTVPVCYAIAVQFNPDVTYR